MAEEKLGLCLVGVNHKSSTVEEREVFQLNRKEIPDYLKCIFQNDCVREVIILNTCNRLEFYLVVKNDIDPLDILQQAYENKNIDFDNYREIFYIKKEQDVTTHLFRVVSGLDSMVLGEYQIQGQVKEAYSQACEAKTVDKIFHKLFHAAFRTGKNVRNNTSIADGRKSVSGMAAQIIIDNSENGKRSCSNGICDTICIIGVNENTKIMAEKLVIAGYSSFIFVNRTKYKAEMYAEQFNGTAYGLEGLRAALSQSDVVFSSTGAKEYIIDKNIIYDLVSMNKLPKLFIDMAVPRDIDKSALTESTNYFDIGDLKMYLEEQQKFRKDAIPEAEKIIDDEAGLFRAWSEMRSNSILEPYSETFEKIRQLLLEEYKPQFSVHDFEKAEKMSKSLLHRMQSTFIRAILRTNQEIKVIKQHRDSM